MNKMAILVKGYLIERALPHRINVNKLLASGYVTAQHWKMRYNRLKIKSFNFIHSIGGATW